MKTNSFKLCALVIIAFTSLVSEASSQEVAARGSQDVQASFSTLKTMINEVKAELKIVDKKATDALSDAKTALGLARTAKTTADAAYVLAEDLETCGNRQRFLDSNDKYKPLQDNSKCVDPADTIQGATRQYIKLPEDKPKDLTKSPTMMISVTCGTSYTQQWSQGDPKGCLQTYNKFKVVFHTKSGGQVPVMEGSFPGGTLGCPGGDSLTVGDTFFVKGGRIVNADMIQTPAGIRITNKKDIMGYDNWNGKIESLKSSCTASIVYY